MVSVVFKTEALRESEAENGTLARGALFCVTHLYWKESSAGGVGNLTGTTLPATNLTEFCRDHRLEGLSPKFRAKASDDPSDAVIPKHMYE